VSKKWVEDEITAPMDLRLVPMALAIWVGCLIGLAWADPATRITAGWAAGLCGVIGMLSMRRVRRWAGTLAAIAGFVAALATSLIQWHLAAANPLTEAASRGSWATVTASVTRADPAATGRVLGGRVDARPRCARLRPVADRCPRRHC